MKEIKIIGRGGQGGKTAAEIIAKIGLNEGKFIQSFPEYGAERQGAPVFAYTRISDEEITIHSDVKNPDIIAIIDPTLIIPKMVEGIKSDGILIVNTNKTSDEVRDHLKLKLKDIYTVDATSISIKYLGKNIPNTPMLGAISTATGLFSLKDVEEEIKHKFLKKIGPEFTKKNIDSIREASKEVKQ
ncbi:pyruvate synthase [Candidatus Woesearchaeota archaeon]|mgnify:CR=1 FL=1|nr:MAG: pyruvate synthase [Candidatus Woesearchaeota archaeon]